MNFKIFIGLVVLFILLGCSTNGISKTNFRTRRSNKISTSRSVEFETLPVSTKTVLAIYPEKSKPLGLEGLVIIDVEIFYNGSVGEVEVTKSLDPSPGGLDEAAIIAVKQWEFIPAKNSNGRPVSVVLSFPITLSIH